MTAKRYVALEDANGARRVSLPASMRILPESRILVKSWNIADPASRWVGPVPLWCERVVLRTTHRSAGRILWERAETENN